MITPRFPPVDAAPPDSPVASARGGRCSETVACAAGLECTPSPTLPGGYCASSCGDSECDGACVATARAGELCAARCTSDADCRADEGYVCDPAWHACLVPNFAAIIPRAGCPTTNGRDLAFATAEPWAAATAPGEYQAGPSAVILDDGDVVAVFTTGDRTHAARDAPALARDRTGTIYATSRAEGSKIRLVRSTDRGSTWTSQVAVHDADCPDGPGDCLGSPLLAIGPRRGSARGAALSVMYGAGANGLRVRASLDGGVTFSPPVTAIAGDRGSAPRARAGARPHRTKAGRPLGAFGSAMQEIEYTASTDGAATFSQPVVVSGGDEVLPYFLADPAIAVDDKRKLVHVVYVRGGRDARWELVLATSKDRGAEWTRTRLAGDGCAIHMVPTVALDARTGTLHVAYYDNEGGSGRFVHASCTPGPRAMKCTQHGAINSAPFAALSTVRRGATWLGDRASLLLDAKRRALHALWTQPVLADGEVVGRIFHAKAPLPK